VRQLKVKEELVHQFKKDLNIEPPLPSIPSVVHQPRDDAEEINQVTLRQLARNDLFKHAHMRASSRCMKRGDGVLSQNYSLLPETPTLIDIATARSFREEMHHKFWKAYNSRKDAVASQASKVKEMSQSFSPKSARLPLPSTLHDAYLELGFHQFSSQLKVQNMYHRAIAITEAQPPFKIVEVNKEWINMCGYSRKRAIGSTLKDLLQGPETDLRVAKDLVSSLVQGEDTEFEAVLTNYRQDGSKFRNHIRVGPIKNAVTGKTTHFVGVFREMSASGDDLSSACDEMFANV
jgi:PAS domain S-box-containing protein